MPVSESDKDAVHVCDDCGIRSDDPDCANINIGPGIALCDRCLLARGDSPQPDAGN